MDEQYTKMNVNNDTTLYICIAELRVELTEALTAHKKARGEE